MNHRAGRVWQGTMPVQFRYTPGAAGLRFFQTLKHNGTLSATRCDECAVTYLPPRLYCENCLADLSATWCEVPGVGRVHTFAVLHADREGRPLPQPEIVAFVRIDGTDGGLLTRLVGVQPADVQLGMPVAMVLVPPRRRRGRISDIVGFGPPRPARPEAGTQEHQRRGEPAT